MNSARSQNQSIHRSFFINSKSKCDFLHFVARSFRRQLSQHNKADKSPLANKLCSLLLNRSERNDLARFCVRICSSFSLSTFFKKLLIRQGVEPNPGPDPQVAGSYKVISQNCRGLTDPVKFISLLRKVHNKSHKATILCLQETHQLNRFALDNHFKGSAVVDNGDRASRGTAILVPEQFEVCMSRVSGEGRWSLAAIKDKLDCNENNNPVSVIASVYAPN